MAETKKARQEIELSGEQKYRAALKNIAADMQRVRSQQALTNSEYEKGDQSTARMARQYDLLGQKLTAQKNKLKLIADEIQRVTEEEGENSERVRNLRNSYAYAQRDINNTERAMKQLGEELEGASKKSAQLAQRLREAGLELPGFAESAQRLGGALTKALSAPIAALGVASGKMFLDYEKQLYTVATIADTAAVPLERLSDDLLKASDASGMAAESVAEAAYGAISAGVDTAQAAGFVEIAAKAAKGGLTDVTTAVDGATSAINAWGLGYENAESVFDRFIVAQNLGKTTLGDIASQIGNLTGLAPQVGVSLDAVLAATAALTKNGVQTSAAMNGLKAVMSAVIKPTSEAAEEAKRLGLNFSAEALREKGFTAFLQDVIDKTGNSEESMAKLFGSVEGLSQVLLLAGSGAEDYAQALEAMGDSAGATQAAFDRITGSDIERMSFELNRIKNQGIRLGGEMSPAFEMIGDAISGAATWMGKLSDEQVRSLVLWGGVVAAIGPAATAVGKLASAYKSLKPAMTAAKALFSGGGGITLAVAGGAAAIAALITAVNKLSERTLGIDKLQAAVGKIDIDEASVSAAAKAALEELEPLTVHARNLVNFELEGANLYEAFSDNLGAGREHYLTSAEYKQFKQDMADWVGEAIDAGRAAADEKTQGLANELDIAAKAYQNYALQLAQMSRAPAEEEIAQLEVLKERVIALGQEILGATNQAAQAAELAWIKTRRGEGTAQDAALAAVYAASKRSAEEYRNEEIFRPRFEAARSAVIASDKSGDEAEYQKASAELRALEEEYAANQAAINEAYAQSVDEIVQGLSKQYPKQMETLRQISELEAAIQEAVRLLHSDEEYEGDWDAAVDALAERLTGEAGAYGDLPSMQQLDNALTDAYERMAGMLGETDVSGIMESFYAQVQSGLLDSLDPALLSEDMAALLTMVDLTDDAKTIGQQWAMGEIEGIEGSQAEVNAAVIAHCKGIIDAACAALGINSPSREAREMMGYWTQGEVEGLQTGSSALRAAIGAHLKAFSGNEGAMFTYGQRMMAAYVAGIRSQIGAYESAMRAYGNSASVQSTGGTGGASMGAGGGKTPVSVQVQYSGGVSARDSQRLAQQLGQYILRS